MHDPRRVGVLISGQGSNMRALIEQAAGYAVVLVGSNRPEAGGLAWARQRGVHTWAKDSKGVGREQYDRELSEVLDGSGVGTIALAGFMRILSPWFVERWAGHIVNIHPSLLPKYRGVDTHARAIAAGDSVAGCSVHVVTDELDSGEVLGRTEVPVLPDDRPETLRQRVLAAEHELYPRILAEFVNR